MKPDLQPNERKLERAMRWMLTGLSVLLIVIATWVLFGPMYAFHHDVSYGIFGYMLSGGEDADPGDFQLFGEHFWLFPKRFAVTVIVWFVIVGLVSAARLSLSIPKISSGEDREDLGARRQ